MKNTSIALAIICFCGSMAASAGQTPQKISFEEFRTACQSPAKFHNQIAPTNIQVSCKDVQVRWLPDTIGSQTIDTSRQVTTSVISDKYVSDSVSNTIPSAPQAIGCPTYKQVFETVETVRAISCDEVIAFNGGGTDFCTATLNSLMTANPNSVKTQSTGQSINLCSSGTVQQGQGQGQGPQH